jgi:hypothetical protein
MLQKELAHITTIFKVLTPAEIVNGLRHQVEAFWRSEWPFNEPIKDGNPLAWWESLQNHPHAHVLAVSFTFCSIHMKY